MPQAEQTIFSAVVVAAGVAGAIEGAANAGAVDGAGANAALSIGGAAIVAAMGSRLVIGLVMAERSNREFRGKTALMSLT